MAETRFHWRLFLIVSALLLAPLCIIDLPPLLDYPNHLARAWVIASGKTDPYLSSIYAQHWAIIPNLAIDLILPGLMHVFPVYAAGKIVLGLSLLLPMLGVLVYSRAGFGCWMTFPFCAALMAYNAELLLGFMSFEIAIGLALLGAACWIRFRDAPGPAIAIAATLYAVALFFMHLFGLLFLAVLVGSEELAARPAGRVLARRLAVLLPAAITMAVLYRLAPLHAEQDDAFWVPILGRSAESLHHPLLNQAWLFLSHKAVTLFEPFMSYGRGADLLIAFAVPVLLYLGLRRGVLRLRRAGMIASLILLLAFWIAPFAIKGTGFIDARFVTMLAATVCGSTAVSERSRSWRPAISLLMALAFSIKMAGIIQVWNHHRHDLADFRLVIAGVTPGSKVLVVTLTPEENRPFWNTIASGRMIPRVSRLDFHLPALLLLEHRAFWPLLFTAHAKQPLVVLPPYDRLSVEEGTPPDYAELRAEQSGTPDPVSPYLADWPRHFDDVLLLEAGGVPHPEHWLAGRLQPVAIRDIAALYRIIPPDGPPAAAPGKPPSPR